MRRLLVALVLVAVAVAGCLSSSGSRSNDAPGGDGTFDGATRYAPGWPDLSDAEIRPGVDVGDGSCTTNFVFSPADNSTLYIGSAAHCFGDVAIGEKVTVAGIEGAGTLAYCSWATIADEDTCPTDTDEEGDDNDFALVAIDPDHRDKVHPAVLGFGGPTGLATSAARGDEVMSYGNSALRDPAPDDLDSRRGYVVSHGEWTTNFYLAGPGIPGDSGSDLMKADGTALGVLTEVVIAPTAGSNVATNLAPALEYVNQNTEMELELVTWELLEQGSGVADS